MALLITSDPRQVHSVLFKALDALIENRRKDKAFTDQEEVASKSYFSTLEGLSALLIPLVNLPNPDKPEPKRLM